jgi:hypothetical protein
VNNTVTRANRKEPFARVLYLPQPPKGVCEYILLKKESDPKMKKNKLRILSFILALMLIASAFALSSCDDATDPSGTDTGTPTSSDTPSDTGSPGMDDPEPTPTPEPPSPGSYLGGNTFDPEFDPEDPLCAAYVVPTLPPTTASIEVTLVIEAGDVIENDLVVPETAFRLHFPVTLPGDVEGNKVEDLLNTVNGTNGLTFGITTVGAHEPAFLNTVTYANPIPAKGTHTWGPRDYEYDGWVFRVDDKFPIKPLSNEFPDLYVGTLINETYLDDGDIVHLFFDYPTEFVDDSDIGDLAAWYVRTDPYNIDYDSGSHTLTVPLQMHNTYLQQAIPVENTQMQVNNYNDLAGFDEYPMTGRLLDLDGIAIPGVTMTYDVETGSAIFTGANITPGETYIVDTEAVLRPIDGDWQENINDAYFYLTGAYSKIAVPNNG